jgi:hypothetical protein
MLESFKKQSVFALWTSKLMWRLFTLIKMPLLLEECTKYCRNFYTLIFWEQPMIFLCVLNIYREKMSENHKMLNFSGEGVRPFNKWIVWLSIEFRRSSPDRFFSEITNEVRYTLCTLSLVFTMLPKINLRKQNYLSISGI